uniref:Uncharacterized protein n=1 Tax=Arundo donax TaxID=35708 RepID=A0A0A9A4W1_ARUDO
MFNLQPVLHGHRCGCRCLTRVSNSAIFSRTRQITLGIRHGSRNRTRMRGCLTRQKNLDTGVRVTEPTTHICYNVRSLEMIMQPNL